MVKISSEELIEFTKYEIEKRFDKYSKMFGENCSIDTSEKSGLSFISDRQIQQSTTHTNNMLLYYKEILPFRIAGQSKQIFTTGIGVELNICSSPVSITKITSNSSEHLEEIVFSKMDTNKLPYANLSVSEFFGYPINYSWFKNLLKENHTLLSENFIYKNETWQLADYEVDNPKKEVQRIITSTLDKAIPEDIDLVKERFYKLCKK